MAKLPDTTPSLKEAEKTGRVAAYAIHAPKATFNVYNVYGWTGGDTNDEAAMRTDDILAIITEDCDLRPGTPALICGDINAATDRIPSIQERIESGEWIDCGKQAHCWGDLAEAPTCRASATSRASRIDYFFANQAIFPAIRGCQVHNTDTFKKHQPLQLLIDAGELDYEAAKYRKTASFSKMVQRRVEKMATTIQPPNRTWPGPSYAKQSETPCRPSSKPELTSLTRLQLPKTPQHFGEQLVQPPKKDLPSTLS